MRTGYPAELIALQAAAEDPIQLERIQNAALVRTLAGVRTLLSAVTDEVRELRAVVNRRTTVFPPARGFSSEIYHRNSTRLPSFQFWSINDPHFQ
jgi:hypothetical protein